MIHISRLFIEAFTPNEQLIMLRLLLNADAYGKVEFSDRGMSKATGIPYQQVRTIHQKFLACGTITNAVANAASNANHVFVTICDYDSYNAFNIFSNAVTNAVINALEEKEIVKEKEKGFPHTPLPIEKEINKEKEILPPNPLQIVGGDSDKTLSELEKDFETFRKKYKQYGGKVRGFETEFENFKKKHKDWKTIIPLLMPSLEKENEERRKASLTGNFFPQMKNLQTYINQRSWECYSDNKLNFGEDEEYSPLTDGIMQRWDPVRKCLLFGGYFNMLNDGYNDDNRPNGAKVAHCQYTWIWNAKTKEWVQQ